MFAAESLPKTEEVNPPTPPSASPMFIMWLPPTPVSIEGLFQNGVCAGAPDSGQAGVVAVKLVENAEKLPVPVIVSASKAVLSMAQRPKATRTFFIC
jgi:hypothetical protein